MHRLYILLLLLLPILAFSQDDLLDNYFKEVDSLYREDQFYIGLGINIMSSMPSGMNQSGLSGGFHMGFIRDMPVNKRRNLSIGLGLGVALDTYSQNLFIGETESGNTIFDIIDNDVRYSTNRFITHVVEVPLHFRWRTSNINDDTSFWRIYAGINTGYMYLFRSTFEQVGNSVQQSKLDELNRLRWSLYFSFGKSKINFFFNYTLNPLFNGELSDNNMPVDILVFKTGIVFYIF